LHATSPCRVRRSHQPRCRPLRRGFSWPASPSRATNTVTISGAIQRNHPRLFRIHGLLRQREQLRARGRHRLETRHPS
jgi:hypothetical protein